MHISLLTSILFSGSHAILLESFKTLSVQLNNISLDLSGGFLRSAIDRKIYSLQQITNNFLTQSLMDYGCYLVGLEKDI